MTGPLRFGQEIFLMSIIRPEDFILEMRHQILSILYTKDMVIQDILAYQ